MSIFTPDTTLGRFVGESPGAGRVNLGAGMRALSRPFRSSPIGVGDDA